MIFAYKASYCTWRYFSIFLRIKDKTSISLISEETYNVPDNLLGNPLGLSRFNFDAHSETDVINHNKLLYLAFERNTDKAIRHLRV